MASIIFRGLILFRIENERRKDSEKPSRIVAQLIDCDHMMGETRKAHEAGTDLHTHVQEIQIVQSGTPGRAGHGAMAGMGRGTASSAAAQKYAEPRQLVDNLQIGNPTSGEPVKVADSYRNHCPKLSHILANAPGRTFPGPDKPADDSKNPFIKHVVTIYGGTIRVSEVVEWNAAQYPLVNSPNNSGQVMTPAEVSFLTSTVRGHMASECVVDIGPSDIIGQKGLPNRIEDDDEILITNLPPQRAKPAPSSLHFFCLYLAAGYKPGDLSGNELDWFKGFSREYDPATFPEDEKFLGQDGQTGFPFPYLHPETSLTALHHITPPLTDPWNRPLCPQGDE